MKKDRMEAFSDGVIAILITVMILEMKAPRGADLEALRPVLPAFLSYVLSFVFLGIYWSNHHRRTWGQEADAHRAPPLTAGITKTSTPSRSGVARPPVSRMLLFSTKTLTCGRTAPCSSRMRSRTPAGRACSASATLAGPSRITRPRPSQNGRR
jgi:hypothetical protein